jgi:hypothetical protein
MRSSPTKTVLILLTFLAPLSLAASGAPHWQAVAQQGDVPPPLYEAGISFSREGNDPDTLYRFAGVREIAGVDTLVNDFYALDLDTFTWTNLGSPAVPAARANAQMIPGPCVHCVSVVGGRGDFRTGVMFPEMRTYHINTGRWEQVPAGELGTPFAVQRAAGQVVEVPEPHGKKTTLYAFGGVGNTQSRFPTTPTGLHNDIAVYDTHSGWRIVETSGVKPAPRAWTAGGYDPATHSILVFGGYRLGPDQGPNTPGSELFGPTNYTNDLWSLQLDTFTWTELHPTGPLPSNRDNAAAFFDTAHGRLVVFGGEQFDGVKNDLWYYSPAENRWTQVALAPSAPVPPGRTGAVSFVRETEHAFELYLHGGSTGEPDGELLNDLWKLTWPKD